MLTSDRTHTMMNAPIPAIVSLSYSDLGVPKVVMYWEPDIIIAQFTNVYTDPNP